ncbi:MAG: histidine phosphatase family protein [Planctomycetota bacterium]|nr:histidine phosphatase family protein [Planctomycetota bacterium]
MATEIHATLFLLRRGPVAEKWDRTALGQSDPPLQRGLAPEESAVATAIAALQPSRIVSSDLRRARMTAERISEYTGASLAVRRDLREQRFGAWQGRPWSEIVATEGDAAVSFLHDFCRSEPPSGESLEAVSRRVLKGVQAELRRQQREVVCYVGHAGPIRCLVAHALRVGLEQVQRMQLDPFGLCAIRYQGDASVLTLWNHPAAGGVPGGLPC